MSNASTKPDHITNLKESRGRFEFKARLLSSLRSFFSTENFLEVFTPVRIKAPAPEEHIEAIPASGAFLRTSPELEMKAMLAAGYGKIYQTGPCFREGEHGGNHREEFLMLEWYQAGSNYLELLEFTKKLLGFLAEDLLPEGKSVFKGTEIDFLSGWEVISVREAFCKYAGMLPEEALKRDMFDLLLVEKVEPNLRKDIPSVLIDYPAPLASLARLKKEDISLAERWELYIGGLEIANAFGELVCASEQKKRFAQSSNIRKRNGMRDYPLPSGFMEALDSGIPESSGCALGIDRLCMVLSGTDDIADVTFPD